MEDEILSKKELFEKLLQFAFSSENIGRVARVDGSASMTGECGDTVEMSLSMENGRILEVRSIPDGCLFTQACAGVAATLARGKTPDEALEISPEDIETELGYLPEDHRHCARLAVNTLGEALADFIGRRGGAPDAAEGVDHG